MSLPSDEQLTRLAGATAFGRAGAYVRSGAVDITLLGPTRVEAIVSGTDDYGVVLNLGEDHEGSLCTCPAFRDGRFCKHLVATAIVARDGAQGGVSETDNPTGPSLEPTDSNLPRRDDLRAFLHQQPAVRLAGWLADLADRDPAIEKRLRVYQAEGDPGALRTALARLLRAPRSLDWRRSREFARELDPVITLLAEVAVADPPTGADLFEYALARLFKVYPQCDDSGGDIGARLQEIADRLLDCLAAQPKAGAARARALLTVQQADDWDLLPVKKVWSLLDEAGRRAYAAAIEAAFNALPPPSAERGGARWIADFGAVQRMEALATVRNDFDTLIEVIARDLSSGHAYERIVAVCEGAGRDREATQWAERGLQAHPAWRTLRPLLARQYARAGLADEALALLWEDFQREPGPDTWRRLKGAADRQWPEYRSRALARVTNEERVLPNGRRDVSLRVTLLLEDGDLEGACRLGEAEALSSPVLDSLARAATASQPQRAAAFLRRLVDAALPRAAARDYAALAQRIAQVLALAPGPASRAWLDEIRTVYRARRKLLALLDAATAR